MVKGRYFGVLYFDCKPMLHDEERKCVSEGEFRKFKLLLLERGDFFIFKTSETNSGDGAESGSEEESRSEDEHGKKGCNDDVILDQQHRRQGRERI
jgi:hypothetical protein